MGTNERASARVYASGVYRVSKVESDANERVGG